MLHQRDKSGYLSHDTIAAIATEVGGAISVIRVSGDLAFSTLQEITRSSQALQSPERKLVLSQLYQANGEPLDQALYVRFVHPDSYTGEDLVEYHLHGSSFIAQQLLDRLIELGVRQALPGEFSFRSVRNGKMSLFQAQAVADLITATNQGAVSLALEKVSGSQSPILEKLGQSLRKMAVLGEVGIDFADQDVEEVALPRLKMGLNPIIETLVHLKNSYSRGIRIQEGIRVAFVGLPNAGKSSFFNALLGENRSIVSDIAGTTRDVVSEKMTIRGKTKTLTLRLEDTAGLRTTDNRIEQLGIERTLQATENADLVLFIVDATGSWETVREQWDKLSSAASKTIGILTKTDLLQAEQIQSSMLQAQRLKITQWIQTSSTTGCGIQDAIEAIISFGEKWTRRNPGEVLLTRVDHFTAVSDALIHLERALQAPEVDLFASDIRQALHSLGPLIGETVPDDILGQIFSDFCIGK